MRQQSQPYRLPAKTCPQLFFHPLYSSGLCDSIRGMPAIAWTTAGGRHQHQRHHGQHRPARFAVARPRAHKQGHKFPAWLERLRGHRGLGDVPRTFYNNVFGQRPRLPPFSGNNEYKPVGTPTTISTTRISTTRSTTLPGAPGTPPPTRRPATIRASLQAVSDGCFYANNTIYKFYKGFCMSSPDDKYVGNLMQACSYRYHDESAALAGSPTPITPTTARLRRSMRGRKPPLPTSRVICRAAPRKARNWVCNLDPPSWFDPANHDFRRPLSHGNGARVFHPVEISPKVKGEWHFPLPPADYTTSPARMPPPAAWANTLRCLSATPAIFVMGNLELD